MISVAFSIPYPTGKKQRAAFFKRYGLNAYYAGKHWAQRKADAEEWHAVVRNELRRQGIPAKMFDGDVTITFRWNDRLDIDNHAMMGKFIVDALKGYLIRDDDRRYVRCVIHGFYSGDCIEVEVRGA